MSAPVVLVLQRLIADQGALPCGGEALLVSFDPEAEKFRIEGATAVVRIGREHFAEMAAAGGIDPSTEGVTAFVCALYHDALPGAPFAPDAP